MQTDRGTRRRAEGIDVTGRRVAVVAGRFHEDVTRRLIDGALECLAVHGVPADSVAVHWVAGSFEIPQMTARLARAGRADGVVALGCIIRGETLHFEVLARTVTSALESVGVELGVPVTLGVLTVDTMEQAVERAGGKYGNAGWNAALALVELLAAWEA